MATNKTTWELCQELHKLRVQLNATERFLDMLYQEPELSKHFRADLVELRCSLCGITDCSTRNDRYECLRAIQIQSSKEVKPDE